MIKRIIDVVVSTLMAIIALPVLLAVSISVWASLGRPVLFTQPRPGLHGRIFQCRKFRTMTDERDAEGNLLPDEKRLTTLGLWLRRSSIDELPQLWNVVKGDMSLIGPRPLLVEYLPLYSSEQSRRHETRPGITGWAQVNGRNGLSWDEKFTLDVWYVDHQGFWLDLRILLMTLVKVFQTESINQRGQATMERFYGSDPTHASQD